MNRIQWLLTTSLILLNGCGWQTTYTERQVVPLTKAAFDTKSGFQLDYDLYLPNSYSGWTPNADNAFIYNTSTASYHIRNIAINKPPLDSWGARFKVSSADWAHEFAFTKAHDTPEQSKFGIKPDGTTVQLKHIFYASDMYFELPRQATANYLHADLKIIRNGESPEALLHVYYSEDKAGEITMAAPPPAAR